MKLNPKQLKNVDYKKLALQHGEKAAMVICGVILIWGIYSFFNAAHSDYSPTQLTSKVEQAEEHVLNTTPPEVPTAGPFASLAEQRLKNPIEVTTVAWSGPFWQPVKSRGQRGKPEYLVAVDPVVDADHVTVAIKGPAGVQGLVQRRVEKEDDEKEDEPVQAPIRDVKPYSYVTVRYLVPLKKQIEEYRKARLGSTMPFYYEFELQRQYLLPDGTWSQWETVDLEPYTAERDKWASTAGPVVPPSAVDEALTAELPSRIYGDWKKDGGHPKLAMVDSMILEPEAPAKEKPKQQPAKGRSKGGFARDRSRGNTPRAQGGGFQQIRQSPLAQQAGGPPDPGRGSGAQGTGIPAGQGNFGQQPMQQQQPRQQQFGQQQPQGQAAAQAAATEQTEWLLFRYLDLTVEPGQSYRYHVKLVLRNPNYQVEQELLQDGNKALAEGEFRETEWSEPTPMVTVPDNLRYAVVGGSSDGSTVEMHLFYVDPELGSMAAETSDKNPTPLKEQYKPGDVIAISGESGWLVDMKRNIKVKKKGINASTGDALIDFFGGRESLDLGSDFSRDVRDVTMPYTALVLDSHGDWVTRRENIDRWQELNGRLVEEHKSAKEEKDDEQKGGQFGPGGLAPGQGQGGFAPGQGQGGFGPQGQGGFGPQGQSRRNRRP